ncbi:hypothetical protein K439DRAFT_1647640 [Ramaria rubella]|nr:hypothetical protein K439DRAFT_1647640 [Ramaria rubella]
MTQVSMRFFIEGALCEHFIMQMNLACTTLSVMHKAKTQAMHWREAIEAWNAAMAGTGQPEWNHACNLCTKHILDQNSEIVGVYHAVVTDGISLGHPCCGVHNCKEPLSSNLDRYCQNHVDLSNKCAVVKCHADPGKGYRTCPMPSHRAAEEHYQARGKAMFQLRRRLAKNFRYNSDDLTIFSGNQAVDADGEMLDRDEEDNVDDDEEVDETVGGNKGSILKNSVTAMDCDDKPAGGYRRVFSCFGHCRTHNEQLCVACCGMILGPRSVVVAAMNKASGDNYFEDVALPVDIFHFKSKHKESDEFCGHYCNLAWWIELMDGKTGKWLFNSSAAEQVNSWFGRYHAMTQIMHADRYNFFLDEMIM